MLISDLHDRLRALVRERIGGGLTGTELAKLAGFQQAHVSNFLNRRRGLSIEAMDRIMEVLKVEVRDLMPEERERAQAAAVDEAEFASIPERLSSICISRRAFCGGFVRRWRSSGGAGSALH